MTTKHTPATPLPWNAAKKSPDYTPLEPVRIEYTTSDDGIHFEPKDFAYIAHAANVYPQLVEALRSCVHLAERDYHEKQSTEFAAGAYARLETILTLLRSLGEDAP